MKEIRALKRGIQVMDELCRTGAGTLAELNRTTGLSKSTLRRILLTLENGNMVRRGFDDGRYRANVHLPSYTHSSPNPQVARLLQAANPVLEETSNQIIWPSDITVRDGLYMKIVESNRSKTPLHINRQEIGDRVEMISTAAGRAYIAFCPAAEQTRLLGEIESSYSDRIVEAVKKELQVIETQGYAIRGPEHTGNTILNPRLVDKLSSISMPVMSDSDVACCVNLFWPNAVTEELGGISLMVKFLSGVSRKIETRLNENG